MDRSGWFDQSPKDVLCPECRSALEATGERTVSMTGVITQLYLCIACRARARVRWALDRPGVHLIMNSTSPPLRTKSKGR